jgi:hypothetical protein
VDEETLMGEVIIFPDIEAALVTALNAAYVARSESARASKVIDIRERRPAKCVTIERAGGVRAYRVTDGAQVMVECHAPTDDAALTLAQLTRGIIHSLPGSSGIYRVTDVSAPGRLPHPLSKASRYVFTVLVEFRGAPE